MIATIRLEGQKISKDTYSENNEGLFATDLCFCWRERVYNQISIRMADEVDLSRPTRRKSKLRCKGRYRQEEGRWGRWRKGDEVVRLARVSNAQVS